jgi:hypothetical protein
LEDQELFQLKPGSRQSQQSRDYIRGPWGKDTYPKIPSVTADD